MMVTFIFASFLCLCFVVVFFPGHGKCRKLSFWHILGHNLRTTRHNGNSDQIFGFLDWFYIRLVYKYSPVF